MQVISQSDIEAVRECVATVGIFDGVHAGHRFLIDELKVIAAQSQLKSAVITFAQHPRKVLNPDFKPQLINTLQERIENIATTGVDYCILLDFTPEIAALTASEFIQGILFQKFHVRTLLVGHDHRFGHNRSEGFPEYQQYGKQIGVDVIQATRFITLEDDLISSSQIRNALQIGDVEQANRLLTYSFSIAGIVVKGFQLGQKIGFPTANIQVLDGQKLIPSNGVYAVKVKLGDSIYNGMLNIGVRPTVSNDATKSIEVNIFDFNNDIYDQEIKVFFIAKIRDEKKFDGLDNLISQLKLDHDFVQIRLNN